MKKLLILALIFSAMVVRADEGMWLPNLIGKDKIKDMQAKGLKLSAKDLYDVNEACLKDAIVRFDGGCTAELVSKEGLILTNHHCGYDQIQAHSSVENDYLTHGFAARNRQQELPNKGLKVTFLQSMNDVTSDVLKGTAKLSGDKKNAKIKENIKAIVDKAKEGGKYNASVEPLYYGNQYYLFVYKDYKDVRLVFAPASSIGKFGGDTDNWMWPRHTGDFSIFRIYANKNNEPAEYSAGNVPFVPKKSFTISTKGVKEGDFTFVYGYPGRTQQYLHSGEIKYIVEKGNPTKIGLRTLRLGVFNAAQSKDKAVRIKYAAKNASVSNAWKKWQGELLGLQRLGTYGKKVELEKQFEQWASDKPEFSGVTTKLGGLYDSIADLKLAMDYYTEALMQVEFVRYFVGVKASDYEKMQKSVEQSFDGFFKDYVVGIDKDVAKLILAQMQQKAGDKYLTPQFVDANIDSVADRIFSETIFVDSSRLRGLLKQDKESFMEAVASDPAMTFFYPMVSKYVTEIIPAYRSLNDSITTLYTTYMKGLMSMQSDRSFFPDANSTLRIAYGKVGGYEPRDAVYYKPQSTLDGVMQKDNPEIYDYDVPQSLRDLYSAKDFGRWSVDGTVPVAFIATNHTTGGNSGSPVLNGDGELIGINFDRVWEGTMSDLEFDPVVCRNIAIDIRYVLFIVDKLYGAGYLLDEMDLKN